MKIAIASDHGGFVLKEQLKKYLLDKGIDVLTIIMFGIGFLFLVFGIVDYILVQKSVKSVMRDCALNERSLQENQDI